VSVLNHEELVVSVSNHEKLDCGLTKAEDCLFDSDQGPMFFAITQNPSLTLFL
jgi:hypothetical protein